jgi:preprotein translocase subunit SecE
MGKLQKKKTTASKKKKSRGNDASSSAQGVASAGASQKPETATTAPEVKKQPPVPAKKPAAAAKAASGKKNYIQQAMQFLREVKIELKKVTWPSRKQTIGSTLVVLILVMVISFFLGIVDFGLSNLVRVVLG